MRRSCCSEVLSGLKAIYRAADRKEEEIALSSFEERLKKRYPSLVRYLRYDFPHLTASLKHPEQVHPYIYTTNQLEMVDKEIRRQAKTACAFSSEESLLSVLYLVLKFENEKLAQRRLRGFSNLVLSEEG